MRVKGQVLGDACSEETGNERESARSSQGRGEEVPGEHALGSKAEMGVSGLVKEGLVTCCCRTGRIKTEKPLDMGTVKSAQTVKEEGKSQNLRSGWGGEGTLSQKRSPTFSGGVEQKITVRVVAQGTAEPDQLKTGSRSLQAGPQARWETLMAKDRLKSSEPT